MRETEGEWIYVAIQSALTPVPALLTPIICLIHIYTHDGALQVQLHFVGSGRGRGVRFGPFDDRPSLRGDLAQRHRLYRRLAQGLVEYVRDLRRFVGGVREV